METKLNIIALVFPAPGHLNSVLSLLIELQKKGHNVHVYTFMDAKDYVLKRTEFNQLNFKFIGNKELPLGSLKKLAHGTLKAKGLSAVKPGLNYLKLANEVILSDEVKRELKVCLEEGRACIIADELLYKSYELAKALDQPILFFSQALSSLPLHPNLSFSPCFIPWQSSNLLINKLLHTMVRLVLSSMLNFNFKKLSNVSILLPYNANFEPTRLKSSKRFYSGPWVFHQNISSETKRNDYTIYASLGTLVDEDRKFYIFSAIINACNKLQIPVVISLGQWKKSDQYQNRLSSSQYVTIKDYVDQIHELKTASLFISHAGLNSVQEAIVTKTPTLLIPLKHDQYGVAERARRLGIGSVLDYNKNNFEQMLYRLIKKERDLFSKRLAKLQSLNQSKIEAKDTLSLVENILKQQMIYE